MKIPPQAEKVFTGVIFDTYQWEQEMYDGSKATFEMVKRPATAIIIPTQGDQILISEQEQPTKSLSFSLIAGRGEESEESLQTAKRELLEEVGYTSEDWELYLSQNEQHKIDHEVTYFIARNCKKTGDTSWDNGEKIYPLWVGFEEFLQIVEHANFWGKEFADHLFRLKQDPEKLEVFRKKLFSK